MKKQNNKTKKTPNKAEIIDVDCETKVRGNAVLTVYKDVTYITSVSLLYKLTNGTLKTKKDDLAKSLKLGILEHDDETNESEIVESDNVFLTKKGKSYYVSIDDDLLITPITGIQKLLSGEYSWVKWGLIKRE